MGSGPKRIVEVRLLVIVLVDLADPTLIEALAASRHTPPSLATIVSSEVTSNLESVSYVDAVIVSQL